MKAFAGLLVFCCGCLGEATFTSNDLSAGVFDLSPPIVDQGGGGDGYTCVQLNDCERACASDPKPVMCVANCRAMANPAAVSKETALQGCFGQYCPQGTDAGTAAICTPTDAGFSSRCATCITNSQTPPMSPCDVDLGSAVECHLCYDDAVACKTDK